MSTPFDSLTDLRNEWQSLHPLSAENRTRLWQKLRLEWNYHSNHIEGNTLTYGETELLLLHDRTIGNHSHREYLEMKAHDVAIEHVRKLAEDKTRLLGEGDIRDLNKIILKEPFWKAAETADGQSTRKEIIPGQYKTTPNNVRLPNGDTFFFASVDDTPPRMSALAAWLRQELDSPSLHPVALAAKLHHDFVLIHPFDDGNGRVARLLVNYVLMRSGYLPLIVRTEDKANYLTALQLADAGELSTLIRYLLQLAEWSMQLGVKAGKGESIEDPGDIEKEISLFIREQEPNGGKVCPRSPEGLRELYELGFKSFIELVLTKMQALTPLFVEVNITAKPSKSSSQQDVFGSFESLFDPKVRDHTYTLNFQFRGYRGAAKKPFDLQKSLSLKFNQFNYALTIDARTVFEKLYSQPVLSDEATCIADQFLRETFEQVKKRAGD
jgi:prophage maintenance system killer protein